MFFAALKTPLMLVLNPKNNNYPMTESAKKIIHTTVFQNGPNGGNPCPVVLDGDDISSEDGKRLATRFGAETIIVLNPNKDDSDFGLRYFVPKYEMEMCVHGTIAATTVLRKMGYISKTPVKIEAYKKNAGRKYVFPTLFQYSISRHSCGTKHLYNVCR